MQILHVVGGRLKKKISLIIFHKIKKKEMKDFIIAIPNITDRKLFEKKRNEMTEFIIAIPNITDRKLFEILISIFQIVFVFMRMAKKKIEIFHTQKKRIVIFDTSAK